MGFYDEPDKVDTYIAMCSDYEGSHIYRELSKHLKDGRSVLEIGSGPGFDIPFLKAHYQLTGSDLSEEFLLRLKQKFRGIPFPKVDAKKMDIHARFDCVFSNKVLHHLTEDELLLSLANQTGVLNPGGLIAHSFWIGDENKEMEGMLFTYYRKEEILEIV